MRNQLLVVAVALALLGGCKRDSANVARGKDLLLIDEVKGAVAEFKIAVKQNPDDKQAKALLLYASGVQKGDVDVLLALAPPMRAFVDEKRRATLGPEQLADLTKFFSRVRQERYEMGIDTKDLSELAELLELASRYVLENRKDQEELDSAALALGMTGDEAAAAKLCERLKAKDNKTPFKYLVRIGEPALKCLDAMAENKEGLGYEDALTAARFIRTRSLAATMWGDSPKLRGFGPDELISFSLTSGRERAEASEPDDLARGRAARGHDFSDTDPKHTLRALWAMNGTVLLLEGMDAGAGRTELRFFRFDNTQPRPLVVKNGSEKVSLSSDRPVLRFKSDGKSRVEILRAVVRDGDVARPGERLLSPQPGNRVFVDRVASPGVVQRLNEYGLVVVKLDVPQGSESEVEVPADVIRVVRFEKTKKTMVELLLLKLDGDELQIDGPVVTADAAYAGGSVDIGDPAGK